MGTIARRMVIDLGIRIEMRDGVGLIADVYRPAEDGKWPVILLRCPYDRQDPGMGSLVIVDPAWLARHGFAVVVQDVRGRGESEGEFDIGNQEIDDGYDTIEWAATQPWSTGAVGIYGSSYMGFTAYQAAGCGSPHLKAAVAIMGSPRDLTIRQDGGVFQACFYTWYTYLTELMTVSRKDLDPAIKGDLMGRMIAKLMDPVAASATLPLSELDVISDEELAPSWKVWLREPNTGTILRKPGVGSHLRLGDAALLHISGYRDFQSNQAFELATNLAPNPLHRFIAGPWTHRGPYSGSTGAKEFPGTSTPAGPLGWGPLLAAWFDIHLRGGTGADFPLGMAWLQGDPVRYYVEGEDRWAEAPSWPPAAVPREWELTSSGQACSAHGDGILLAPGTTAQTVGHDSFVADPHNPFPSCGGAMGIPEEGPEGVQDQRAVDYREDVLVYTSEVLNAPVSIVGTPQLVLQFSTNVPDADICVTLVDVDPLGFAGNVAFGAQRTRYREGSTSDWLEPGKVEEITVTLHNTAHVFKAGHRIRMMIAGASYPRLGRNLHTRTVPEMGTMAEAVTAVHAVHTGPILRSRLVLNEVVV